MPYITVNFIRHIDWSLPCCCQYGGTWESCYPCFPWYQPYAPQVSWQLNLQNPIHHIKEGKDAPRKSKNHSTCYDLQFLFSRCFVFKWYNTMRCLASFITTTKKIWMYPRDAYRLVPKERANTFNFLKFWTCWWLFFTGRRHVQTPTWVWRDGLRIVPDSRMNNHRRSSRLIESIRVHLLVLMVWFKR